MKKIIIALAAAICMLMPVTASAADTEETTSAVEILASSGQTAEENPLQAQYDSESAVIDNLNKRIEAVLELDPEEVDPEEVKELVSAFNALTMAQKARITGYAGLAALSENTDVTEVPDEEKELFADDSVDTDAKKMGTGYVFRTEKDTKLSFTLKYVDTDGDGSLNIPDISVTGHFGDTIQITSSLNAIQTDNLMMNVLQADDFIQFDITYADPGLWRIDTSETVYFSRLDYAGAPVAETEAETFSSETEPATAEAKETEETTKNKSGTLSPLIKFFLFILFSVAVLIGVNKFAKRRESGEKIIKRKTDILDNDDDEEFEPAGEEPSMSRQEKAVREFEMLRTGSVSSLRPNSDAYDISAEDSGEMFFDQNGFDRYFDGSEAAAEENEEDDDLDFRDYRPSEVLDSPDPAEEMKEEKTDDAAPAKPETKRPNVLDVDAAFAELFGSINAG